MSERLSPNTAEGEADRRARASLRVLPHPGSALGRAELLARAWARDAEQDDWCVDPSSALQAGCEATDLDVAAMSASERRAVHLTRQRIRAQAVLAAAELGPEAERREQLRRNLIVLGSALLHLVGFVVLATAVADLRVKPRPSTHEHLFEARAVVPIELEPALPAEPEPEPEPEQIEEHRRGPRAEPRPARERKSAPAKAPAEPASDPAAEPSEAAPQQLHGVEFSSAGAEGRESGGAGGFGHGDRDGGGSGSAGPGKSDVNASPRGGLLEPEYPADLERRGIEGSVLVKVWIDEHGHVIKAEVAHSSGYESFDHNALVAAQRQEWDAALDHGEPVASTRRYRVHYRQR